MKLVETDERPGFFTPIRHQERSKAEMAAVWRVALPLPTAQPETEEPLQEARALSSQPPLMSLPPPHGRGRLGRSNGGEPRRKGRSSSRHGRPSPTSPVSAVAGRRPTIWPQPLQGPAFLLHGGGPLGGGVAGREEEQDQKVSHLMFDLE